MAKYKAYPEYKDSGVEWLGEIPRHWVCTQIKYGYDVTLGKMLQKNKSSFKDELKPYLKAQNIQPTGVDLNIVDLMWFSPEEQTKLLLKPNDVLISEGGDVGRSTIWLEQLDECYIQNAINRVRAIKGNSSSFLNYWMIYLKSADFINTLCNKATIAHYTAEKVEMSPVLLPTSNEQLLISAFLDHETAKIDNLIEKQQQLIELLKEKRQAVISHAVTKGINPDAPMKDSGVEWLGKVPEHWDVLRIKQLSLQISKGTTPSTIGGDFVDKGIRFLKAENIGKSKEVNFHPQFHITSFVDKQISRSRLQERDVLVIIAGATTGMASVLQKELLPANTNQAVSFIRLINVNFAEWVYYWLGIEPTQCRIWMGAVQAAQPNLSMEDLGNIPILVPPRDEIKWICLEIEKQSIKFKNLISKAESAIELMQERRTALISAAVTGKIDVRNWVAPEGEKAEVSQEATA